MLELKTRLLLPILKTTSFIVVVATSVLVVSTKKGMILIQFADYISKINAAIDLSRRTSLFVCDLFDAADSNYLNEISDMTKPNRLASGTDHINAAIIRTFPADDNVEEVTKRLLTYINDYERLARDFRITNEKSDVKALCYALAKTFFSIIKSSESQPTNEQINQWYQDCLDQPMIYINSFDEEFKASLFQESGIRCPITGKPLNSSNTRIIRIYQKDINNDVKEELKSIGIFEPENEFSFDNCIAVHDSYGEDYDFFGKQTIEDVQRVFFAKQNLIQEKIRTSSIQMLKLNKDIKLLIDRISDSSLTNYNGDPIKLNYDPVVIKNKIGEDSFLVDRITMSSDLYYKKIKGWFLNAEEFKGKSFVDGISKTIKSAYDKEAALTTNKRQIIRTLALWILSEVGLISEIDHYEEPATTLIYFFIQNCEVFVNEVA